MRKRSLARFFALIQIIALLLSSMSAITEAEGEIETVTSMENIRADASDISVEGTNSFGNMLSDLASEESEKQEENNGFNIFSVEVTGACATVEFEIAEDCLLVVAVYSEDGVTMLGSGEVAVCEEETEADVEIVMEEMPEYFLIRAFLMTSEDYSPLSTAYESPMYTKEMQELLQMTTDDFADRNILNLDETKDNNFAVYSDEIIVIESVEGSNAVVDADYTSNVYRFQNADKQILNLAEGDVFSYQYGDGELLITKVVSVETEGTYVIVTGSDVEMGEVFDYMKIDTSADIEDGEIDDSALEEGIIYNGLVQDTDIASLAWTGRLERLSGASLENASVMTKLSAPVLMSTETEGSVKGSFAINKELAGIKGSLTLELSVSSKLYLSLGYQYFQLKFTYSAGLGLSCSESLGKITLPLTQVSFSPIVGLYIKITPSVVIESNVTISLTGTFKGVVGFEVSNSNGITNLTKTPEWSSEFKMDGEIFIGIIAEPSVSVVCEQLANVAFKAKAGLEITASYTKDLTEASEGKNHICSLCLTGDINAKFTLSFEAKLLDLNWLTFTWTTKGEITVDVKDFYYSLDFEEFAFAKCPHYTYRVTVATGKANTTITVTDAKNSAVNYVTDGSGNAEFYLAAGNYVLTVPNGSASVKKSFSVEDDALKVICKPKTVGETFTLGTTTYQVTAEDPLQVKVYSSSLVTNVKVGYKVEYDGCSYIIMGTIGTVTPTPTVTVVPTATPTPTVSADEADYEYTILSDGTVKITKYIGSDTEVTVPSTLGGGKVVSIGNKAFFGCNSLTELSLPEGLTSIGNYAFDGCNSLTELSLSKGLTGIGSYAFRGCNSLTELSLPEGLTSIGESAFLGCNSLTELSLPEGLTSIGSYAFAGCHSLTELSLPEGLTSIGDNAFAGCHSLTELSLLEGLTSIGSYAFFDCSSLTELNLPEGLMCIGELAFSNCSSLTELNLPEGLTSIGKFAFSDCESLTQLSLPEGLTSIGRNTFCNCYSLTELSLPKGLTSIGDLAFYNCYGLTELSLPEGLMSIGVSAFRGCRSLTQLSLPEGLTSIGEQAFYHCTSLTELSLPKGLTSIGSCAFGKCWSLTELSLPEGLTSIGSCAFTYCSSLTELNLPEGLTSIGIDAFCECNSLTKLSLPEGLTSIGGYAFSGCRSLTELSLPEGLTSIGSYAFYGCSSLTELSLPKGLNSIGESAFYAVYTKLQDVYFGGTEEEWNAISIEAGNECLTELATIHFESALNVIKYIITNATFGINKLKIKKIQAASTSSAAMLADVTETEAEYKIETFTELTPGNTYNLYAVRSPLAGDFLSGENLLYIMQAEADEDGQISLTYAFAAEPETVYWYAVSMEKSDLSAATVTVSDLEYTGEEQNVEVTVSMDGKSLTEGVDYYLERDYKVTEPGEYTVVVCGTGDYTGKISADFQVYQTIELILGDVNGDGEVTAIDARWVLQAAAGKRDLDIYEEAGDVNGDGEITAIDARWILQAAAGKRTLTKAEAEEHAYVVGVYGQSELGRDLTYYCFTPEEYSNTVLLNFAIHGFEDEYDADGQVLVDTANALIAYYDENPDLLRNTRLIIIPCANPDGLYEGATNNGFGRCNANGIDLNRDFDANYVSYSTARNYTPYAFSAAESRALRDLCYEYQPDIVLDLHGWLDETIGDAELAEVFYSEMGLSLAHTFTATNCSGYFSNWAHQQGALALLVEFTSSTEVSLEKLEAAINRLLCGDYDNGTGEYALDENYEAFQGIQCYTLSQGHVTTYAGFNLPFQTTSYIDGANDQCTIDKIYQNGWVRVQYPVSSGTKTAYCPLSEFIDSNIAIEPYLAHVSADTKVYRTSAMGTKIGSVWTTDDFYVVADNGTQVQIIYPLDSGGWKMGWVEKTYLIK